jgi:RNA polymerase sigma-70 factor (ECF subfamily)
MQSDSAQPIAGQDEQDDGALAAAAQRDPAAFALLYDRHIQPIYRYVYSRVGSRAEAEDVTSQTFVSALEALPRYRHRGHFDAWLFSIARSKVMDHFRHQSAARRQVEPIVLEADSPGDQVPAEDVQALRSVLRSLPEEERELLRLRYGAGLTFGKMASVLGRKEEAVKKTVYRLLVRIRASMEARSG